MGTMHMQQNRMYARLIVCVCVFVRCVVEAPPNELSLERAGQQCRHDKIIISQRRNNTAANDAKNVCWRSEGEPRRENEQRRRLADSLTVAVAASKHIYIYVWTTHSVAYHSTAYEHLLR